MNLKTAEGVLRNDSKNYWMFQSIVEGRKEIQKSVRIYSISLVLVVTGPLYIPSPKLVSALSYASNLRKCLLSNASTYTVALFSGKL